MTPLPSYIDPEAWEEYEAMRRRIKKPMTPRVIRQKLALLQRFKDAGHDVNAVIDAATNGHWLDFYQPKEIEISSKTVSTARVTGEAARYLDETPGKPSEETRRALKIARSGLRMVG
jgi:hypothetical protein